MKILFVENHARFARVVCAQFLFDHEVDVVPSLAQARERLLHHGYDVVLLDYDLDDGKGVELLSMQLPVRPYFIAVSSHQRGNEALRAAGADAVCSKLHFAELATLLREVAA